MMLLFVERMLDFDVGDGVDSEGASHSKVYTLRIVDARRCSIAGTTLFGN